MLHQMDELQWSLEKFFNYLVTDKFAKIPRILELVNREYIRMIQRLPGDQKRNLFCIEAVLNEARQQNWRGAKRNLIKAEQQYQDIILPYWKEEKDQHERLQDLHLRAKAQIHSQQYHKKRSKSTKTDNASLSKVKSKSTDGSKKKSLKDRLFSRSHVEAGVTDGINQQQSDRTNGQKVTLSVNGLLPNIVSPRANRKTSLQNGELFSTRKTVHQQMNIDNRSTDLDTISTRQSLLSGPIDMHLQGAGNNIAFINDSQKMQEEAPDVPDLSNTIADKISEAFLEVYESEWQDAFKEIKKVQADKQSPMKDMDIIKCLREIVLKSYFFCKDEAIKQATLMEQACVCVMTTGELKGAQDLKLEQSEFTEFLYEYRKHIADLSVFRVQNVFMFNHLDKILDKFTLKRASKSAVSDYTKKCVELTWWMCVQRPPIFMLPGDENGVFDNKLYKHYKKVYRMCCPPKPLGECPYSCSVACPVLVTEKPAPLVALGPRAYGHKNKRRPV